MLFRSPLVGRYLRIDTGSQLVNMCTAGLLMTMMQFLLLYMYKLINYAM